MTYWVIARFDKKNVIYMAADIRASHAAHSDLIEQSPNRNFSDVSEKLFGVEYRDKKNNIIRIGLCTSGYASGYGFTIAQILKNFLESIRSNRLEIANGEMLISHLLKHIPDSYDMVIDNENTTLGNHIVSETAFGVGMFINDKPFIASWDTKSIKSHNDYLEADFSGKCLKSLYSQQGGNFNTIRDILDNEETKQPAYDINTPRGVDFVRNIIFIAAKTDTVTDNAAQKISKTADTAIINSNSSFFSINLKEDLNKTNFQTPMSYGSDRTPMPDFGTSGVPSHLIAMEDALRRGQTIPAQISYPYSQNGQQLYPPQQTLTPQFQLAMAQTSQYNTQSLVQQQQPSNLTTLTIQAVQETQKKK